MSRQRRSHSTNIAFTEFRLTFTQTRGLRHRAPEIFIGAPQSNAAFYRRHDREDFLSDRQALGSRDGGGSSAR
jgi:hypothetical protein